MHKADVNRFFQSFKEKTFQVMTNNNEFKDSPLSRFFSIEGISPIREKIKNPFIFSGLAVAISLTSLHFSLNNSEQKNIKTKNDIQNYLVLSDMDTYYDDNLEIIFNSEKIKLSFDKHKLEMYKEGNVPKYLIVDDSVYNERLLSNINWDFKTPAAPFQKYFHDDYQDKIPTEKDLNEIENFYGLPHNLLLSMAHKESRLSLYKTSNKDAKGFLGFQEATARDFGLVTDDNNQIFNAYAAADTAARYILWLNGYVNGLKSDILDNKKDHNGFSNLDYSLAAYNAGQHKVKRGNKKRVPNYKETKGYIKDINLLLSGDGYIVKKGDTVYDIAQSYDVSLNNLFRNNLDIQSNVDLKAGEVLIVSKNEHKELFLEVEKGFNMSTISRKTGISLGQLLSYNELEENSIIKIGQTIKIPPLKPIDTQKYSRKI